MSSSLGHLPRELVAEIAQRLDTPSLVNLSETCKDLNELLKPEMAKRAVEIALAPRHFYEWQYAYAADAKEGIDLPKFIPDEPFAESGFKLIKGEILGKAVRYGHLDLVKFFLEAGANPNAYIVSGTRMLSLAVKSRDINMVDLLLQFGADPNLRDVIEDLCPLDRAINRLRDDMVEMLVNAGSDLTQFDVLTRMVRFCSSGVLDLCISRDADFGAIDAMRMTVLHYLVQRNDQDIFNQIIPHVPANVLNALNHRGETALHVVIDPQLVGPLLALGLDLNVQDSMRYTALNTALKERHFALASDLLARGCQLDVVNQDGETELHLAVKSRQVDLLRQLLQRIVNIDAHGANVATPLHYAVRLRDAAMVNVLLTEGPTQPDLQIQDAAGRTALQEAQNLGEAAIAQLFPEEV